MHGSDSPWESSAICDFKGRKSVVMVLATSMFIVFVGGQPVNQNLETEKDLRDINIAEKHNMELQHSIEDIDVKTAPVELHSYVMARNEEGSLICSAFCPSWMPFWVFVLHCFCKCLLHTVCVSYIALKVLDAVHIQLLHVCIFMWCVW